ncbi:unnamed protein product [Paramecium primaurelia]|uniref:Uncharacterized protein n=1 Tax=Paramecium primaurelia TaxID=5886 RepID=A0A8S1PNC5_PARPR|nr:unnamed protein product [Paramecium primaurelia]
MMQHQNFQLDQLMIRNLTQYLLITRQNQKKKGKLYKFLLYNTIDIWYIKSSKQQNFFSKKKFNYQNPCIGCLQLTNIIKRKRFPIKSVIKLSNKWNHIVNKKKGDIMSIKLTIPKEYSNNMPILFNY